MSQILKKWLGRVVLGMWAGAGIAVTFALIGAGKSKKAPPLPGVPPPSEPLRAKRVVLLGDSHAEGLAPHLGALVKASERAYASDWKRGSGSAFWRSHFPAVAKGFGIGPDDVIVMSLGGNDYPKGLAVQEDTRELVTMIQKTGARFLWLEPTKLPFPDMGVVSVWKVLDIEVFPTSAIDKELVRGGQDEIHLVPSSYKLWGENIWAYLLDAKAWLSAHGID